MSVGLALGAFNGYYGQSGYDNLGTFCDSGVSYVTLSSINVSPQNGPDNVPGSNFAGHCIGTNYILPDGTVTDLKDPCSDIGPWIPYCQEQGVKVLLSIGGALGDYEVTSVSNGQYFAEYLYKAFGPYDSSWDGARPFGNDSVDGFDFDIEYNYANEPYIGMVEAFKSYDPTLFITASPQCPTSNNDLSQMLQQAPLDALFIQFYNNPVCDAIPGNTPGDSFNFDSWVTIVQSSELSKDAKVFIGLPASTSAVGSDGSGYISPAAMKELVCEYHTHANFGGISLWDLEYGKANVIDGRTYDEYVVEALQYGCNPVPTTTSHGPTSTSSKPTTSSTSSKITTSTTSSKPTTSGTSSKPTTSSTASKPTISSTSSKPTSTTSSSWSTSSKPTTSSTSSKLTTSTTSTSLSSLSTSSKPTTSAGSTTSSKPTTSMTSTTSTSSSSSGSSSKPTTSSTSSKLTTSTTSITSSTSSTSSKPTSSKYTTSTILTSSSKSSYSSSVAKSSTSTTSISVSSSSHSAFQITSSSMTSDSSTSSKQSTSTASSKAVSSSAQSTTYSESTTSTPVTSSTPTTSGQSGSSVGHMSSSSVVASTSKAATTTAKATSTSTSGFSSSSVSVSASTRSWTNSTITSSSSSSKSTTSSIIMMTSTKSTTSVYTVTKCPPEVTNCPVGSVITETIAEYTTVCPITETETHSPGPATTSAVSAEMTTNTVFTTHAYTVTKCPPQVTNCPVGSVTTETIPWYTTVCPVTASEINPDSTTTVIASPMETGSENQLTNTTSAAATVYTTITIPTPSSSPVGVTLSTGLTGFETSSQPCTSSGIATSIGSYPGSASSTGGCSGPRCPSLPGQTGVPGTMLVTAGASRLVFGLAGLIALVGAQILFS